MNQLPKGFRRVNELCPNCKHCFTRTDYDENDQYYCTKNAPARPKCGSICMNEAWEGPVGKKKWNDAAKAWNEWAEKYEIPFNGTCDIK